MKLLIIFSILAIVIIVLKSCVFGNKIADDTSRPSTDSLPTIQKDNDKIILVKNVNYKDIKSVLTAFCNMYNKNSYLSLPRLSQISVNSFAITFPYDIDFPMFCFAVNFLKYPVNINWNADVRAWATTKAGDEWITDKSQDKKVMLFLAQDDKEYDNVFLTTQDNIGYKLGFASGEQKKLLTVPKEQYISQIIDYRSLENLKHEDFK